MRHLVLALMIILLPLRGWIGDTMATEMVSSGVTHLQATTKTIADPTRQTGANPHSNHASQQQQQDVVVAQAVPDCAGHGAAEGPPGADTHCATCTVCQACHTVAFSLAAVHSVAVLFPPTLPYSPAVSFASALAALGQKPPIS
jgi:hypothetical protein